MLPKTIPLEKIEQMIKKKILIKDSPEKLKHNSKKGSLIKYRFKQVKRSPCKLNQKNLNNNIVIMNMPPPASKIDFLNDNFQNNLQSMRKFSHNFEPKSQLFSNHTINNGLQRFDTIKQRPHLSNNFMDYDDKQSYLQLKRYKSLNIRISSLDQNKQSPLNSPNISKSTKPLLMQSYNPKISIASIEFKPCLRQLFARKPKTESKTESKMKKSEFNYQRAISTSTESRKKAFQKVLNNFESALTKRNHENPQPKTVNIEESPKSILEKQKISRQISTSCKTRIESPENNKRLQQKQDQSCRPWSAGKKSLIKLQSTEQQNPLQFYSINQQL